MNTTHMNRKPAAFLTLLALILTIVPALHAEDWKRTLREELPLLGHRNWIVIADSAYQEQTNNESQHAAAAYPQRNP